MTVHIGWAIAALFIGAIIGFFTAGLCIASAQNDKEEEERRLENNDCFNG